MLLAAESAIPVFPDVQNNLTDKEPLVVQLAISSDHVVRYSPVDFYVRLKNQGHEALELFFNYPDAIIADSNIEIPFPEKNKCPIYRDNYWVKEKAGRYRTSIILAPNQPLIIKMPYCFIRKDADVAFVYSFFIAQNNGYKEKKVSSNSIHITVEDKPLNKEDIEKIQNDCRKMLAAVPNSFEDFRNKIYCSKERSLLAFYSPYSLPLLKENLVNSPSSTVRFLAADSLSFIAANDSASVKADPSIADILINCMKTETDKHVKVHIVGISYNFEKVMTDAQKITKQSILFDLLEDKDEDVRYLIAFGLCLRPLTAEERQRMRNYLDKPSFLKPEQADQIRRVMKEVEEKSIKGN